MNKLLIVIMRVTHDYIIDISIKLGKIPQTEASCPSSSYRFCCCRCLRQEIVLHFPELPYYCVPRKFLNVIVLVVDGRVAMLSCVR